MAELGFHVMIEDVRATIDALVLKLEDAALERISWEQAGRDCMDALPMMKRRMTQIETRLDSLS